MTSVLWRVDEAANSRCSFSHLELATSATHHEGGLMVASIMSLTSTVRLSARFAGVSEASLTIWPNKEYLRLEAIVDMDSRPVRLDTLAFLTRSYHLTMSSEIQRLFLYIFVYWSINLTFRKCLLDKHKIIKIKMNNKQSEPKITASECVG